jgi:hypothetical protein
VRFLRSAALRPLVGLLAGLLALALTAPWSGVMRCTDSMDGGSCTSRWFTVTGADAWDRAPALLLAAVVFTVAWLLVRAAQRRLGAARGSARR